MQRDVKAKWASRRYLASPVSAYVQDLYFVEYYQKGLSHLKVKHHKTLI